jgi:hypothetical protein
VASQSQRLCNNAPSYGEMDVYAATTSTLTIPLLTQLQRPWRTAAAGLLQARGPLLGAVLDAGG